MLIEFDLNEIVFIIIFKHTANKNLLNALVMFHLNLCRKLEDLSVDEFMLSGFDSDEEDDCEDEESTQQKGEKNKHTPQKM